MTVLAVLLFRLTDFRLLFSLQSLEGVEKSSMTRASLRDDSDSEDDSCHANDSSDDDVDDDDDDDVGACGGGKSRDLEWDNSTLSI